MYEETTKLKTAEELRTEIIARQKSNKREFNLKVNNIEKIFWRLCLYFTDDIRFGDDGSDLNKGIALNGKIGCGKTNLMKIFQGNDRYNYKVIDCVKVAMDYQASGSEGINKYLSSGYLVGEVISNERGWCFDDLGTEGVKKNYGNELNVMGNILILRYSEKPKIQTHITSNLTAQQIEDFYGARVRSRMREIFNVIDFPKDTIDLRK